MGTALEERPPGGVTSTGLVGLYGTDPPASRHPVHLDALLALSDAAEARGELWLAIALAEAWLARVAPM